MFKNATALLLALCMTLSAFGGTFVLLDDEAQAQTHQQEAILA